MQKNIIYALTVASGLALAACGERDGSRFAGGSAADQAYQTALRCYHAYAFATSYVESNGDPNGSAPVFKAKQDEGFERLKRAGALAGKSSADILEDQSSLIDKEKFGDAEVTRQRLEEAGECDANDTGTAG